MGWREEYQKAYTTSIAPNAAAQCFMPPGMRMVPCPFAPPLSSFIQINSKERNWTEEFKSKEDEEADIRATARRMLDDLDLDDPKLESSRFVAYLRDLAEVDQGTAWKERYFENIKPLGETDEWLQMEKTWNRLEATGEGYQDFAQSEFGDYIFADLSPIESNSKLTRDILRLEALLKQDPNRASIWHELGKAQQANEMDPQAIAALLQATKLDEGNKDAWLALAASCVNENCIPDALTSLWHVLCPRGSVPKDVSSLRREIELNLNGRDKESLLAQSIYCNMNGQHQEAIATLSLISEAERDWSIKNRIGASLANNRQFPEALQTYSSIEEEHEGGGYPRVWYNRGISLMCQDRYPEACSSFVKAIETQLSVPKISFKDELQYSYESIWESLRVTCDLWGRTDLSQLVASRDLTSLKQLIN